MNSVQQRISLGVKSKEYEMFSQQPDQKHNSTTNNINTSNNIINQQATLNPNNHLHTPPSSSSHVHCHQQQLSSKRQSFIPYTNPLTHQDLLKPIYPTHNHLTQTQLKQKLIRLFKRDKQKNHSICDQFMNDIGLKRHCANIQAMIQYVIGNQYNVEDRNKSYTHQLGLRNNHARSIVNEINGDCQEKQNQQKQQQQHKQTLTNPKSNSPSNQSIIFPISTSGFTLFSQNSKFIAQTFSRDKIQILLQLHGTNTKLINFLNFLLYSLRSFIYTNEKQWILMKDQIQRYLSKYQDNVEKIYEIDQQQDDIDKDDDKDDQDQDQDIDKNNENIIIRNNNDQNSISRVNVSYPNKQSTKKYPIAQSPSTTIIKHQKTKLIKKSSSQTSSSSAMRNKKKLTLQNYKSQTTKITNKLSAHQLTMCNGLKKLCYATFQRFQHLVQGLKTEMIFVIGLLQKADKFKESREKYLIRQFLLGSRRVGVQSLIYMQRIFMDVIAKIQQTRRRIFMKVEGNLFHMGQLKSVKNYLKDDKGQNSNNMFQQYKPRCKKQGMFVREVQRLFGKLQETLMVGRRNGRQCNMSDEYIGEKNKTVSKSKYQQISIDDSDNQIVIDDENQGEVIDKRNQRQQQDCAVVEIVNIEKEKVEDYQKNNKNQSLSLYPSTLTLTAVTQQIQTQKLKQKIIKKQDKRSHQYRLKNNIKYKPKVKRQHKLTKEQYILNNQHLFQQLQHIQTTVKPQRLKSFQKNHKKSIIKQQSHQLPPIISEDQPNQSSSSLSSLYSVSSPKQSISSSSAERQSVSSSLEFLVNNVQNFQNNNNETQMIMRTPTKRSQDKQQKQSMLLYQQLKKSNNSNKHNNNNNNNINSGFEQFQSLSIDIPQLLCLKQQQGEVNMEDIDNENNIGSQLQQQLSSFYNEVMVDDNNNDDDDQNDNDNQKGQQ